MDVQVRFGKLARVILREAETTSHGVVEPIDLLGALLRVECSLNEVFTRLWDVSELTNHVPNPGEIIKRKTSHHELSNSTCSPAVSRVFELAWASAAQLGSELVEPEHLLIGLVGEGRSQAAQILIKYWLRAVDETKVPGVSSLLVDIYITLAQIRDGDSNEALVETYYTVAHSLDPSCTAIPPHYINLINRKKRGQSEQDTISRYDQYSIIDESEVVEDSDLTFDMVAGIDDPDSEYYKMRRIYELIFLYPAQYKELAEEYGVLSTNSVLLFGPTGVGKTYVSKAITGEFRKRTGEKLTFINAKLSSILDKWVGNTEKNISKLTQIATDREPSILFLDEIDSLGMSRQSVSGRDYRVDWVNHLLTELDRVRASRKRVLIVACTNSIAFVDPAIRRRFGNPIIIPMPDNHRRRQIFEVHLGRLSPSILAEIDYDTLAQKSEGLTPADIEGVVRQTAGRVWLGVVDRITSGESQEVRQKLRTEDFLETLQSTNPSVSIGQWVQETLNSLRKTRDELLAERVERAFKGYYQPSTPNGGKISFSKYSERKWRASKTPPPHRN